MQTNQRVKLKVRYSVTFITVVIFILIYIKFPACGNPVLEFKQPIEKFLNWNLKPHYEKNPRINRRELFDVLEYEMQESSLRPPDLEILKPILSANPHGVQNRYKNYDANDQDEFTMDPHHVRASM